MSKISIRFFEDREVRAIWDDKNAKWWFSVLDIVAVLTDQADKWAFFFKNIGLVPKYPLASTAVAAQ